MKKSVMCIVQSQSNAEEIVRRLQAADFSGNDISVLLPNKGGSKDFALEDFILREKITHFDHERIPERIVHARGTGRMASSS
jgi:catalase